MNTTTTSRRTWLRLGAGGLLSCAAAPWAGAAGEGALADDEGAGRSVSTAQLGVLLDPHFPIIYPVPGFLALTLRKPRLLMRPASNRIDAEIDVTAQGPALNREQAGQLGVGFALRFEASDKTVRAHRLSFNHLSFPGIRQDAVALIQIYGPALAEAAFQEVVLHRFSDKDLAVLDVLGLRPGRIRVTESGLRIEFEAKAL